MKKLLWFLVLAVTPAFAQIPVLGSFANMTNGYQVGGAAPNNDYLCGNGTYFVPSASPCTAAATIFYQTVDANGTPQTQRSVLNFSAFFDVSDSGLTNVDPTHVGANATCTNPASMTVDVYGRTTACANGPTKVESFTSTGCTPPTSTDGFCTGTLSLPTAMPAGYQVFLQVNSPDGAFLFATVTGSLTTTTVPYTITCAFNCATITSTTVYALAYHP